jgi:hypothetical protein
MPFCWLVGQVLGFGLRSSRRFVGDFSLKALSRLREFMKGEVAGSLSKIIPAVCRRLIASLTKGHSRFGCSWPTDNLYEA